MHIWIGETRMWFGLEAKDGVDLDNLRYISRFLKQGERMKPYDMPPPAVFMNEKNLILPPPPKASSPVNFTAMRFDVMDRIITVNGDNVDDDFSLRLIKQVSHHLRLGPVLLDIQNAGGSSVARFALGFCGNCGRSCVDWLDLAFACSDCARVCPARIQVLYDLLRGKRRLKNEDR